MYAAETMLLFGCAILLAALALSIATIGDTRRTRIWLGIAAAIAIDALFTVLASQWATAPPSPHIPAIIIGSVLGTAACSLAIRTMITLGPADGQWRIRWIFLPVPLVVWLAVTFFVGLPLGCRLDERCY